jgi:hypothetical protein
MVSLVVTPLPMSVRACDALTLAHRVIVLIFWEY